MSELLGRSSRTAIVISLVLALGTLPSGAQAAPLDIRAEPFAFTETSVPNSNFSEPSMALTKRDSALFCGPNRPTNAYIRTADWKSFTRSEQGLAGGSDCDLKVGADNAVYLADLQIFGSEVLKSLDDGATFALANRSEDPVEQDRQWLGPDPSNPNVVYLAYHDLALEAEIVAKSTDGGRTFVQHSVATTDTSQLADTLPNTFSGPVRVDPTDPNRVYLVYGTSTAAGNVAMCQTNPTNCPFGTPRKVFVARSTDGGINWTDVLAIDSPEGSVLGNLFPWITVDAAGNVYVTAAGTLKNPDGSFTNGMFLASSADHGLTWSKAAKINAGTGAVVFPTIVAGKSGVVDAAWIESSVADQSQPGIWTVHFAQTRNALDPLPTFAEVTGPMIREGIVCTFGINCSGNRELGDFIEIALDSFGYAHVAVASTDKSPDHSSRTNREVIWWRQDSGPSATSEPCPAPPAPPAPCVDIRPRPPG